MNHTVWHHHPHVRAGDELTVGERAADSAVKMMGSWRFIIAQTIFVVAWVGLNLLAFVQHWDPYPFILLNLAFSTQAAYAAPLILLSSVRADSKRSEIANSTFNNTTLNHEALQEIRAWIDSQETK